MHLVFVDVCPSQANEIGDGEQVRSVLCVAIAEVEDSSRVREGVSGKVLNKNRHWVHHRAYELRTGDAAKEDEVLLNIIL